MNNKIILSIALFIAGNLTIYAQPKTLKNLSYSELWSAPTFFSKTVSQLNSMKDGLHYSDIDKENNIIRYDYKTGNAKDTLLNFSLAKSLAEIKDFDFSGYAFSPDESKILLTTEEENIYRHSTKANFLVYDIKSKSLEAVSANGKQMYAQFSPDGNHIAFVRDNNLFVKNILTGKENAITTDGKKNEIINGANDWVYEEEFSFSQSYQWSPDGKHIAYYRFDESLVKEFTLTYYDSLYPREERYKYPKAGEQNSLVDIYVYDLTTGKKVKANVGTETNQYIPRIKWTADANTLCIFKMNRHQNKLELLLCNASTGTTSTLLTEENKTFIEIENDLTFLLDKKQFVWSSSKDGWRHLYLYDMTGKMVKQITKGNFDVMSFYGYDEKSKTCFYQSAEVSPMDRQVYSITLSGSKKLLSQPSGTCNANFNSTFTYFVNTYSAVGKPHVCDVYDAKGNKIRTLEDNAALVKKVGDYNLGKFDFFKFKTSENIELNGWMIKPPDFDAAKKYPVFVFLYGGPGNQTVVNRWGGSSYFWYHLLAQKGYIVVSVDNRGTPGRGKEFADAIYKNMGHNEVNDQIELAKYLIAQPYVDKDRIGVHGWSYGGYMTSLLMTKGADYYKVGIAVAPVTNWRYYDSIYTERYLQTPQENPKGYDDNSPQNFADKLKGKFLLIHGLADDNVHFQNSAELVKALVKNKKQFDSFYYPNQAHGISRSRAHVYEMMTDYILKNL